MATITSPRPQSPANSVRNQSPDSSIRPSLETTSSNLAASPTPSNPTQRRNRAALRDYYNLNTKPTPSQNLSRTASIASSTASNDTPTHTTATQPSDLPPTTTDALDTPSFDADTYISDLLRTSSLKDILRTEATLISEIRNLDGERKALVYDNYSKLIKATQTIGEMQRSMNDGGSLRDLESVRGAVERITRVTGELSLRCQKGREQGKEERESWRMEAARKRLVRWVMDSPGRFEGLVEDGKGNEVLPEWETVRSLLERWKDVEGAEEVRIACEAVIAKIQHEPKDGG